MIFEQVMILNYSVVPYELPGIRSWLAP